MSRKGESGQDVVDPRSTEFDERQNPSLTFLDIEQGISIGPVVIQESLERNGG